MCNFAKKKKNTLEPSRLAKACDTVNQVKKKKNVRGAGACSVIGAYFKYRERGRGLLTLNVLQRADALGKFMFCLGSHILVNALEKKQLVLFLFFLVFLEHTGVTSCPPVANV